MVLNCPNLLFSSHLITKTIKNVTMAVLKIIPKIVFGSILNAFSTIPDMNSIGILIIIIYNTKNIL